VKCHSSGFNFSLQPTTYLLTQDLISGILFARGLCASWEIQHIFSHKFKGVIPVSQRWGVEPYQIFVVHKSLVDALRSSSCQMSGTLLSFGNRMPQVQN